MCETLLVLSNLLQLALCCGFNLYCRLKLLDDQEFIYLQRGLPKVMVLDEHIRAVSWGQLQLVFHTDQQLASFLKVLRCVCMCVCLFPPRRVCSRKEAQVIKSVCCRVLPWDLNLKIAPKR
jgi:hypothetical protein